MSRKEKGLKWPLVAVQPVPSPGRQRVDALEERGRYLCGRNQCRIRVFLRKEGKGFLPPFNFLRYRDLFRTKTRKYNLSFVLIVETDRFSNRWKELLRRVISPGNALARGRKTGCKYQESGLFVSITRRAAGVRFSTNFQHRG